MELFTSDLVHLTKENLGDVVVVLVAILILDYQVLLVTLDLFPEAREEVPHFLIAALQSPLIVVSQGFAGKIPLR